MLSLQTEEKKQLATKEKALTQLKQRVSRVSNAVSEYLNVKQEVHEMEAEILQAKKALELN